MKSIMLLAICLCVTPARGESPEARLVQTAQGPVRGYRDPESGLFIFYSIPYATAPTGPYRFKEPLPAPVWFTPFEAVDKGIICPQTTTFFYKHKFVEENCLIANIYVPAITETNLPVLVLVHGGGYQIGYGNILTPKKLVEEKKIIVVTFNYRVGIHGFLCLGTKDVPGNAGMKDQVALLRWVKKNIANFGGNPDDITLGGSSSGASAVDILMLSETTKGLFTKVIPESGAGVTVWSVQLDPLENAKIYAKKYLNFTNVDDVYALEELYKTASFESITIDSVSKRTDGNFFFTPCVERDTGVEKFFEDTPVNILKNGKYVKVPVLYGFANMEGLFRLELFSTWKDRMNDKFSDFLPADLQFENENQKEEVAKSIKEFYFGDEPVSDKTITEYIDYFTDITFAYATLRSLKLQVEAGSDSIYLYEYSFVIDALPNPEIPQFMRDIHGANHCAQTLAILDDIPYLPSTEMSPEAQENYEKMRALMRDLWYNFIITGKPVPEGSTLPAWPPAGADGAPHMSLGETVELRGELLPQRARFWEGVYQRHYRAPQAPPAPPPPRTHSEL